MQSDSQRSDMMGLTRRMDGRNGCWIDGHALGRSRGGRVVTAELNTRRTRGEATHVDRGMGDAYEQDDSN